MYRDRHYPTWDKDAPYWTNWKGLDQDLPTWYATITPVFEGNSNMDWHGVIQCVISVINPLTLTHPDTLNQGERDILVDIEGNPERANVLLNGLLEHQDFNPELMGHYHQAQSNVAELLGVNPSFHYSYQTMDFYVNDVWDEGETGEDAFARIIHEHPVISVLIDSAEKGEVQQGAIRYVHAQMEAENLPEQLDSKRKPNLEQYTGINAQVNYELNLVKHTIRRIHQRCAEGVVHNCRRGDETVPVERGRMTATTAFLEQLTKARSEGAHINPTSYQNYRSLVEKFTGEEHELLLPAVNKYGDIELRLRAGPYEVRKVILAADGNMFFEEHDIAMREDSLGSGKSHEKHATQKFNVETLTHYLTTGTLEE